MKSTLIIKKACRTRTQVHIWQVILWSPRIFVSPKDHQSIQHNHETLTGSRTEEGSLLICTNKRAVGGAAQFYAQDDRFEMEPFLYLKRTNNMGAFCCGIVKNHTHVLSSHETFTVI